MVPGPVVDPTDAFVRPNDLRGAAAYIEATKQPGDGIVFLTRPQRRLLTAYREQYQGLVDLSARLRP